MNIATFALSSALSKPFLPPRVWARRTTTRLTQLGPTFVKLGQIVASRSDVFDDIVISELKKLQDAVDIPFDSKAVIDEEVSMSLDFEPSSFAGASLSVVHRGKTAEGEDVVIKVKRPKLTESIVEDLDNVNRILHVLEYFNTSMRDLRIVIEEYAPSLLKETDFQNEIENMRRFYNYNSKTPWLRGPKVYEVTENCIVMSDVKGVRIDEVTGMNRNTLAREIIAFTFDQIIQHGFFHADPHAGNILCDKHGKLNYIDFGLCIDLGENVKADLEKLLQATIDRDLETFYQLLISLDVIIAEGSDVNIKSFLRIFFRYLDRPLDGMSIDELRDMESQRSFRFTLKWIILFKTIICIDGISKELSDGTVSIRTVLPEYGRDKFKNSVDFESLLRIVTSVPMNVRLTSQSIELLELKLDTNNAKVSSELKILRQMLILILFERLYGIFIG